MGLGRQVADAYIEVHGDLSDFRKDLEKARPAMQEWAAENADDFMDGFKDRMESRWNKQWNSIIDTMESGTTLDFNNMIKNFDLEDLDAASEKIHEMLRVMQEQGKLSEQQMKDTAATVDAQIKALQRQHFIESDLANDREMWGRAHKIMMAQLADAQEKYARTMDEAIKDNETWARTFEGIAKNDAIKRLNEDFEKLAKITREADWEKFAKGFRSYEEMEERVKAVTAAMLENNRISEENAVDLNARTREYIATMREQLRLMDEQKRLDAEAKGQALTNARLLREEMERYNASLDGMVRSAQYRKIEADFRDLTTAIGTADWSKLAKGKTDMDDFRASVQATAVQLRQAGRIGDEEFARITAEIGRANVQLDTARTRISQARGETRGLDIDFRALANRVTDLGSRFSGTFSHLKGIAGANVLTDIVRDSLHFAQNIDRVALGMGRTALKAGSLTSLIGVAVAGMVTVGSDLAALGNIGILAPGFLAAAGIQMGVLVAAFKDMKTVLKDLGPQFSALQDSISAKFWKQAEQPVRNLVESLMPTLNTQLGNTATALGTMFAALTDGFTKNATPARVEGMFKKMNAAIKTASKAMAPLTSAFVTLGEHASDYFGRFADWIVDLSTRFDKFITAAAKDGRLKKWTDAAIEGFKDAGRSIGAIVEIFAGINAAATKAGIGGLASFRKGLEEIADFANSDRVQRTLTTMFEGMKGGIDNMAAGFRDLGPALESAMPSIKASLQNIGTAVGGIATLFAGVLSSPVVQQGLEDFTGSLAAAIDKLKPAIGPFSDSLGHMLTILGQIGENVAEIVTVFTVELAPVVDLIGDQFMRLADPLTESITKAVKIAGPLLQGLNQSVIAPLVTAIRDGLLPAIDRFVAEAAPFLKGVAEAVGPVFETLVGETLPEVLRFAQTLFKPLGALFDLMTPAIRDIVAGIATSFTTLADAMEDFNTWADPAYTAMEKIRKKLEEMEKFKLSDTSSPVADLIAKYTISAIASDPVVASFATFFGKLSAGWTGALSKFVLLVSDPKTYAVSLAATMANNLPNWMFQGFKIEDFAVAVGAWLHTNIYVPLKDAWKTFLVKLALIFVGGGGEEESGGGATPMGGMAVGAKVMPQVIDPGAEKSFLDGFIAEVLGKIGGWGALIGASFATWQAGAKAQWDGFWGSLPGATEGGMGQSSGKVATHTVAMGINIGAFIATNAPKWAAFFTGAQQQTSTSMGSAAVTVAAKTIAMTGSINTWATTSRATWIGTLSGMAANAVMYWNSMSGTTTSKLATMAVTTAAKTGLMKTNASTGLAGMAAQFVLHFTNAQTTTSSKIGTIAGIIAGLKGKIESAFNGMRGTLEGIGKDAMDGFQAGIESRAGLIGAAAAAVVAGAIRAAREAQDSHSPSKVFRGLGQDGGDGYALGFTDSESPVQKAAAALVDSAVGAFAKSKMYIAGADAALGFANGLGSNASTIAASFDRLVPVLESSGTFTVGTAGTPGVGGSTPGGNTTIVNIAEGAIPVTTPTKDPELVASKVIDGFASFSNF